MSCGKQREECNAKWAKRWVEKRTNWVLPGVNPLLKKFFYNFPLYEETKGKRILVPLCGKTPDLLWLCKQGLSVVGIEFLNLPCYDFFKENELDFVVNENDGYNIFSCTTHDIKIFQGDFFFADSMKLGGLFNFCWDINSLSAMIPQEQQFYVDKLRNLLTDNAIIMLNCYDFVQELRRDCPPYSILFENLRRMFGEEFVIDELYRSFEDELPDGLTIRIGANAQHVYYLICRKKV